MPTLTPVAYACLRGVAHVSAQGRLEMEDTRALTGGRGSPWRSSLLLAMGSASMAAASFGLTLGYSSPALPDIRHRMPFSDSQGDWFGSLVTFGALFGGLAGGEPLSAHGCPYIRLFSYNSCSKPVSQSLMIPGTRSPTPLVLARPWVVTHMIFCCSSTRYNLKLQILKSVEQLCFSYIFSTSGV